MSPPGCSFFGSRALCVYRMCPESDSPEGRRLLSVGSYTVTVFSWPSDALTSEYLLPC
ncbi:hypothetical protein CBM2599_B50336 [Cupriavidus taiwanensis]|nr:hypothetical protein CBM2600_B10657 [Cupriavidus taiwanensis]SOY96404.1 hypothetical protein CBM2599_B50336 [Cupriavidus taiwanensis]